MKLSALLVGKSHCIAHKLRSSPNLSSLSVFSDFANPGLKEDADYGRLKIGDTKNPNEVARFAAEVKPDFAIIGSEEPLANGVVDALNELGIKCVGPTKSGAMLEASKSFTRNLLKKYKIPGNPAYRVFNDDSGLRDYLKSQKEFVVKPDGLTGGKGVKVFGEHLTSLKEAFEYCRELLAIGPIVIDEKLDGEEFSFQSFFDGRNIAHTIPVQDHKRSYDGDTGPNTGGMGSYTCADHLLPFLTRKQIEEAEDINLRVGEALRQETGVPYRGILYGGFMVTKQGLRVIEYNARFGDPEVMNVLSLLETDFVEVCDAIIRGTLDRVTVKFKHMASVCKYLVPCDYPVKPVPPGEFVDVEPTKALSDYKKRFELYYAAVKNNSGKIELTNSRSLAVVGFADTLNEAERIAENAASSVRGHVRHRSDIGTPRLIQKRIDHMDRIFGIHTLRQRNFA